MPSANDSRARCATLRPSQSGIHAVIDPSQQIVYLARADLRSCIIKWNGTAETVLRIFQPGAPFFDVAKDTRRVLEQTQEANNFIRFIRRQPPSRFAPLQSGSRDRKFCRQLLERQVNAVLQSLEFSETQPLLNFPNQFGGMRCFGDMRFLFQCRSFHYVPSHSIDTI